MQGGRGDSAAGGEAEHREERDLHVLISDSALDLAALNAALPEDVQQRGGLVTFTGFVRGAGISAMALEHYPGMTERSIEGTLHSAARRWPLLHARVVHRVGELLPGDPIVWVAVAARHRAAAFSASEFIMDYLKVAAPLWKRERDLEGNWHWVEARQRDRDRAGRWSLTATHAGDAA
jgi:molybdopterin synthase catalytic subunit